MLALSAVCHEQAVGLGKECVLGWSISLIQHPGKVLQLGKSPPPRF